MAAEGSEDAVLSYIRRYRQAFPRVEIQKQLLLAGHDVTTIDAALSTSDAEIRQRERTSFAWFKYVLPAMWVVGIAYWAAQNLHPVAFWILVAVVAFFGVVVARVLYVLTRD
jgi:hypothetical protein